MTKVKRDLRVLGAQRLECFDSTAWNRYYSIVIIGLISEKVTYQAVAGQLKINKRNLFSVVSIMTDISDFSEEVSGKAG